MMEYSEQLKLQAYLDGELEEAEQQAMADRLARDPQARALAAELRHTTEAVAAFEQEVRLPETREFYWSKIQREIEAQARLASAAEPGSTWMSLLRRVLMPVAAMGMVALVTVIIGRQSAGQGSETALRDAGAFTYHDFEKGTTLVWLSYPAEKDHLDYEAAMFE